MATVRQMLDAQLDPASGIEDAVVRPCPRCMVHSIVTKSVHECYHVTCSSCLLQYCGICGFVPKERGVFHAREHQCVRGAELDITEPDEEYDARFDISTVSKERCDAIMQAYVDACT